MQEQQQVIESSTTIVSQPLKQLRRKVQEKIQESGFESQNQQLIDLGFIRLAQNLRLLRVHKGELQPVITQLQERSAKREARLAAKSTQEGEIKIRKEKRAHKGMKRFDEWPSSVNHLYLDGNTLFRASHYVRKLTNNEMTMKISEKNLIDLAERLAQKVGTVNATLVLENTSNAYSREIVTEKGTSKFNVASSAPEFTALVEKPEESLFVTAKREVRVKLNENGAKNILTVRQFLCLTRKVLGEEAFLEIFSKN